jgi:glucose-6-phosphate isomerase
MEKLVLDYTNVTDIVTNEALTQMQPEVGKAFDMVLQKTGAGNDFLGWVTLPQEISNDFLQDT